MTNTQSSVPFTAAERLQQACDLVAQGDDVSQVWIVYPDKLATLQIQRGGAVTALSDVEITIEAPGEISVAPRARPMESVVRSEHHLRWWRFVNMPGLQEGTR